MLFGFGQGCVDAPEFVSEPPGQGYAGLDADRLDRLAVVLVPPYVTDHVMEQRLAGCVPLQLAVGGP